MIEQTVFYIFSSLAILSALWMVIAKNPVRAVLSMVFTFICMSAIWLLLESEFLAISLILVYVGAVMVLFLFVVMMLDVNVPTFRENFVAYFPIGVLIAGVFLGTLLLSIYDIDYAALPVPTSKDADYSNVKALGQLMYTDYLLPFELAGGLLLVAIVAAISLTFRPSRNVKSQNINEQIRTDASTRVKLVKMPPETDWNEDA
ncbi:MAG: NADH:ubiquinone oxidoreductase subunit J [Legionellales bacterium]|nr:NADH:ubiquinone oxidoreductase subunit J [Legionellales bacterium]|tara:strand:+ start:1235 stop:1843 length:609 start_codon:yes stop_codon:yes gene_type:complete